MTTVSPREKGSGWETLGISVTRTVRLPCATATVETCTSRPMTMVPVRSSMTTRAGTSACTGSSPISAMKRAGADVERALHGDGAQVVLARDLDAEALHGCRR